MAKPVSKQNCKIETITPAQATTILNGNQGNRPVRDQRVEELVRSIREGRWHLTNDAIAMTGFSHTDPGRLLNGQHRLFACCESDTPIDVLVLYGAEEEAYTVMDTGAKRKASDLLPGPNQSIRKSATQLVYCYERSALSCTSFGIVPGNDEIVTAYGAHPMIGHTVDQDLAALKKIARAPSGVIGGFVLIREHDREAADAFIAAVLSGDGLTKDSPELTLRNRLVMEATRSSRLYVSTYAAMVVKAYNARRTAAPLTKMQFRDGEAFPRVVDLAVQPPRVIRRIAGAAR